MYVCMYYRSSSMLAIYATLRHSDTLYSPYSPRPAPLTTHATAAVDPILEKTGPEKEAEL